MPTPSLILVPARFKTGKIYTPLATTSGGVVLGASGDFNVTRATTATRVNASGLIEVVASGIPRLDYFASGGVVGCPALLVEPSGSNLYQRSEDFTNLYWSKVNSSVSGNQAVAPDGNLTAGKLIMNNGISPTAANQSGFNRSESVASSAYRFSIFAKSAEFTGFKVRENLAEGTFLDVNLSNGAITNGSVAQFISPLAENYGNGWYRISWTSPTITSLTKYSIRVGSTGDGTSGIYVWGFQVETGSIATSYIPTTTAAVTRNADVINLSGAVSGCIGQTEGTIYWEGNASLVSGVQDIIAINQNPTNHVAITKFTTNVYRCIVTASGTTSIVVDTVVRTGFVKIAFAYKSGSTALFINGAQVGSTNTTAFTFSAALNSLFFGPGGYYSGRLDQRCRAVALYSTRLTDSELAALTTP